MYADIKDNSIKLYGGIWDGNGPYVVDAIQELLNKKGNLDIHIHSPGGSVIDGNLIYNAIAGAKATVTMHNDGLAASQAAILMQAGSKRVQSSNAFGMTHEVSGTIRGKAKDLENGAKLMRSMNANFIKTLAKRSGKTPEEAVTAFLDGDNWFDAEEALAAGLIDEISEPVIKDNHDMATYQAASNNLKMSASLFEAYEKPKEEETPKGSKKQTTPKNKEMKLDANALKSLGLTAEATDAEINAAIAAKEQKIADMEKRQNDSHEAACVAAVDADIVAGKFLGGDRENLLTDARANLELYKRTSARIPAKPSLSGSQKPEITGEGGEDRSKWTAGDWRKNDTEGFLAMKQSDPERYKEINAAAGIKL